MSLQQATEVKRCHLQICSITSCTQTKERAPLITNALSPRLHEYLGGIVRGLGSIPIEINGVSDHVHLLVKLRPTISVSDFLSKLKSNSSGWAKRQTRGRFAWQSRYGAFTVSEFSS